MMLWGNTVLFLLLLVAWISRSQRLGDECNMKDNRVFGVCRSFDRCFSNNGQIENANNLALCSSSTFDSVIVCCRTTSDRIATKKCTEWKRRAAPDGSCTTNTPLARGGEEAEIGEYPHMVSLLKRDSDARLSHICGGTLIDKDYVLTAAHCVDKKIDIIARIGGHDHTNKNSEVWKDVLISDIIIHPEYKIPRKYNDIALLKLQYQVEFNARILPACLPIKYPVLNAQTKLVVAGWGVYDSSGRTSDVLRKANVIAIERLHCDQNAVYAQETERYPVGIVDSIICANESASGACEGDSGGPLMLDYERSCDVKEVVGIVSRGTKSCQATTTPGTYTNVYYYLDWIVENVWPKEKEI